MGLRKSIAKASRKIEKIENKSINCRGLPYWCDEQRQTAFCLMEAPNNRL